MQMVTNCKNTVQGFKRFHGRAFSDPFVQGMKSSLVYDISQMPTGTTGIKVRVFFVKQYNAIILKLVPYTSHLRSTVYQYMYSRS